MWNNPMPGFILQDKNHLGCVGTTELLPTLPYPCVKSDHPDPVKFDMTLAILSGYMTCV